MPKLSKYQVDFNSQKKAPFAFDMSHLGTTGPYQKFSRRGYYLVPMHGYNNTASPYCDIHSKQLNSQESSHPYPLYVAGLPPVLKQSK